MQRAEGIASFGVHKVCFCFILSLVMLCLSPLWLEGFLPGADAAYALPDLAPTSLSAPSSATNRQTIDVSWTVTNEGTSEAEATGWYDAIYLSSDNVLDSTDSEIDVLWYDGALASGASYTQTQQVQVPDIQAGSYFLIVSADSYEYLEEDDETDNERAVAITITAPDLAPTALTAPTSAVTGQTIDVSWTVENQGTGEAGSTGWYDIFYLSSDNVLDQNDTDLGGAWRQEPLAPDATYTQTMQIGMPQLPAGNYFLILRADAYEYLYEIDKTNNNRAVAIAFTIPDLIPTALTGPASAVTGQTIDVSWTVENQGTGEAGSTGWSDIIYLSSDNTFDESDTYLGEAWRDDFLAPDTSYTQTVQIAVPQVQAGDYFLILRANAYEYLYEGDITNNSRAVAIAFTVPDLIPTALTAPASATTGQTIDISWAVKNQGAGEAGSTEWDDSIYLSSNNTLDESDTNLGGASRQEPLAPDTSYTQTVQIAVPQVQAGDYFLILRADAWGYLYESDEANNDRALAIAITIPDLTPTALSAPSSAATQQTIDISWTVKNQGTGEAASTSWGDRICLSTDNVLDDSDTEIGGLWYDQPVAPGASYTQSQQIQVPQVPAGNYFLILRVDAWGYLYESDEANNDRTISFAITVPDLTPTALTAPSPASTQQTIDVSWTVKNEGTGEAVSTGWYDNIYLSNDGTLDDNDTNLGQASKEGSLASGASYSQTIQIQVPAVPPGDYFLIVRTDIGSSLYETDETDNCRAIPFEIASPDLTPAWLTAPQAVAPQRSMEVRWLARNDGTGTAPGYWVDQLYISQDKVFDPGDTLIGDYGRDTTLEAGATYSRREIVWLPDVTSGDYYLIVRVDSNSNVYETRESNNDLARAIHISQPEVIDQPEKTLEPDPDQPGNLGYLDFSPDGLSLAVASDQRVFLLDVTTGKADRPFTAHTGSVSTVDFSPMGDQILSGARDGTARIWDSATKEQILSFASVPGEASPAVYSADGSKVLTGSGMAVARLWDGVSGEELLTFTGHSAVINSVALSPDASRALTGSEDSTAILWDVETGDPIITLSEHTSGITVVRFSPDGTGLLTASRDGTIRLWDATSGEQTVTFVQGSEIAAAVYSPDSKCVVTAGGWPAMAYLWEIASASNIRTFALGEDDWSSMNGVAISPDQSLIASSHSDGSVRLWKSGLDPVPVYSLVELPTGGTLPLTLRSHGLYYFKIDAQTAQGLIVSLDPAAEELQLSSASPSGKGPNSRDLKFANIADELAYRSQSKTAADTAVVRIAVSKGRLPTSYSYDYFAQSSLSDLHVEVPIPVSTPDTYYVLVFAPYLAAGSLDAIIRADYADFHLSSISPNMAGTGGTFTAQITGTGLENNTLVTLISPSGQRIQPSDKLAVTESSLFATFDLVSATTGSYGLEIKRPTDDATDSISGAVTVTEGTGQMIQITLEGPTNIRPERDYLYKVVFRNTGNVDVPAPFVSVSSSVPDTLFYDERSAPSNRLVWIAAGGWPGDIVAPGQSGSIPFVVSSKENVRLSLETVIENKTPFDWDVLEEKIRPEGMYDDEWMPFWSRAKAAIGSTQEEVLATLRLLNHYRSQPACYESLITYALYLNGQEGAASLRQELESADLQELMRLLARYEPAEDVKLVLVPGTSFDPARPTIVITHGWNGTEDESRFEDLATQMVATYPNRNVVRIVWEKGASTPPLMPWLASMNIPAAADAALQKLTELSFSRWKDTVYIGESFGNGINAYISSHAPEKGGALILNAANPVGYPVWEPKYSEDFSNSIAIQTRDLGDSPFKVGDRTILHTPLCDGTPCNIWGGSHTSHIKWLEQLLRDNPNLAGSLIDCTLALTDKGPGVYDGFMTTDNQLDTDGLDLDYELAMAFQFLTNQLLDLEIVTAIDPNDKIGPPGIGETHTVTVQQTLSYTVNFENMPTASAPVQELVVVDYLDSNLDWTTFRFSEIAYSGRVINIPAISQSIWQSSSLSGLLFVTRDFPEPPAITGVTKGKMAIDIIASFNSQTGRIEWRMKAIDTATGLPPEDALAGFLPPNDDNGCGQGRVTFSVKAKSSLGIGTKITNTATIVFDTNEPIKTNEVFNTIGSATDSDEDGLLDLWENRYFTNLSRNGAEDYDNDGLTDKAEYLLGTDPTLGDTDGDGMPDGWERDYGLNAINDDASKDQDEDGYTNLDEYLHGTNPTDGSSKPYPLIKYGRLTLRSTWKTVQTGCVVPTPVVIMGPPTSRDKASGVARVHNVGAGAFDVRFQEWDYLDDTHAQESAHYLLLNAGRYKLPDGSIWEVGTMSLSGTGQWATKSFLEPFPFIPDVFLTIQTTNDADPVTVRVRNASKTGFEAALFEEELKMNGHPLESVGYLAVYNPLGSGEVQPKKLKSPYILQQVEINDQFSPVLAYDLRLEEEESKDTETTHAEETVSVLVIQDTLFAQVSGFNESDTIGLRSLLPKYNGAMEWGTVADVTHKWLTVPLAKRYKKPVVIVKPVSSRNADPGVVLLRSVSPKSFDLKYGEWAYLNRRHSPEKVFYMVAEQGVQAVNGLMVEAGKTQASALLEDAWKLITFSIPFTDPPAVFASPQTAKSLDPVTTRIRDVKADQFSLTMDEEEAERDDHPVETLGWIAMKKGRFRTSDKRSVRIFNRTLSDQPKTIKFRRTMNRLFPVVVADVVSTFEDDPCTIRYKRLRSSNIELYLQEETSADGETTHAEEEISLFVAE